MLSIYFVNPWERRLKRVTPNIISAFKAVMHGVYRCWLVALITYVDVAVRTIRTVFQPPNAICVQYFNSSGEMRPREFSAFYYCDGTVHGCFSDEKFDWYLQSRSVHLILLSDTCSAAPEDSRTALAVKL
jgi:hypothetical protein